MWRADLFEKTLMLGRTEGGRRRYDRGWDGWMASPTQWTWVWVDSGSWWWTGRPVLWSMGLQRVGHDWVTELRDFHFHFSWYHYSHFLIKDAAAAKSLQSCPTLCDPIDGSPPCSAVPGIPQARTLEWVAISFSSAWRWKVKVKRSVVSDSSRPHGLKPTRLLCPWDFPGKSTGVGCHWQL